MNKLTMFALLIALMFTLTACGSSSGTPEANVVLPSEVVSQPTSVNLPAPGTMEAPAGAAISDEIRLIIGTFKLEGTDQAITAEQAAKLLPLWQAIKDSQGNAMPPQGQPQTNATPQDHTALQQGIDSRIKQIEEVMTPAQLEAIQKIEINQQDVLTLLQEQGITLQGPQAGNGNGQGNGTFMPPPGTPPAGGMPGGNGTNGGQGQAPQDGQMGTPRAGMAPGNGPAGFVPNELIDALIQILQKKAAS